MKRLLALVLALAMIVFAGCSESGAEGLESRPADWNVEVEVLRFSNGFLRAKTVEDAKPHVVSGTDDKDIKDYIDQNNEFIQTLSIDHRDYPYDSAKVTLLENYKGYEILWVELQSAGYDAAVQQMQGAAEGMVSYTGSGLCTIMPLGIQNGKYVTNMDEAFTQEVLAKYDICATCHGTGTPALTVAACSECGGAGAVTQCVCNNCQVTFIPLNLGNMIFDPGIVGEEEPSTEPTGAFAIVDEISGLTGLTGGYACPECGSEDVTATTDVCQACQGQGFPEAGPAVCPTCNGNGWEKK